MHEIEDSQQESMLKALAAAWAREGHALQRFETHISRVIVAGDIAWKFKKPVRLGFLDFSTLAARKFYCAEELRLNRRLAPHLYLDVVGIAGSIGHPVAGGEGPVLDYAVRMKAFSQASLWTRRIAAGELDPDEVDQLAEILARFHQDAPVAAADSDVAGVDCNRQIAQETEESLHAWLHDEQAVHAFQRIRAWNAGYLHAIARRFDERRRAGRVRECHGDLHLANILTHDGQVQVFDCIEFNERMRWIDVMNDVAFTCMDLHFHGRSDLASRMLNGYLALTGDYDGLDVFRYYLVQRALVRAKIALIDARQGGPGSESGVARACRYLAVAEDATRSSSPALVFTRGYSGCGKSTLSAALAEAAGTITIRSDVERKRLHGMAPTDRAGQEPDTGIYAAQAGFMTYQCLLDLARAIMTAGFVPVVDAAFLRREQRLPFQELARRSGARFLILDVHAQTDTLRARLERRQAAGKDASDAGPAILSRQLDACDPLTEEERAVALPIDTEGMTDAKALRDVCARIAESL